MKTLLGPCTVFVAFTFTKFCTSVNPGIVPIPIALDTYAISFSRILCVIFFPEDGVIWLHSKIWVSSLPNLLHYFCCSVFWALNFLFHPKFLLDCLRNFRIRVDKFNYFVCLPWSVYKLLSENKPIRIVGVVVFFLGKMGRQTRRCKLLGVQEYHQT